MILPDPTEKSQLTTNSYDEEALTETCTIASSQLVQDELNQATGSCSGEVPPQYEARRNTNSCTTRTYELAKSLGAEPWLILTLKTPPIPLKRLPYYYFGQPIEGSVTLAFPKPEYVVSIFVDLVGNLINASSYYEKADTDLASGEKKFYTQSYPIWKAGSVEQSLLDRVRGREGERIEGRRKFDFTLTIPRDAKMEGTDELLPPSFMEAGARASIMYNIRIRVKRGSFSPNTRMSKIIALYRPSTPPPFSLLRAATSSAGKGHLVGPSGDPNGWEPLPSVKITGDFFGDRTVDVTLTLSLAKPLFYTRGTHIPLFMKMTSEDVQALELFSSSSAPVVTLMAHIDVRADRAATRPKSRRVGSGNEQYYIDTRLLQSAVWQTANTQEDHDIDEGSRMLRGEIHLHPQICPGFEAETIKLYYSVNILEPKCSGFVFKSSSPPRSGIHFGLNKSQPLQTKFIEIATHIRGNQRPLAIMPPRYDLSMQSPWPTAMDGMFF